MTNNNVLQLKDYVLSRFLEKQDSDNIKSVKSVFLEAIMGIVLKYGQYMSETNIDRVFNTKFRVQILNGYNSNSHANNIKVFGKDNRFVYPLNGVINLLIPQDLYKYDLEIVEDGEFDININKKLQNYLKNHLNKNVILEGDNSISEEQLKENELLKKYLTIVLQHEMCHAMVQTNFYTLNPDNKNYEAIEYVPDNLVNKRLFCYDGGLLTFSEILNNKYLLDLDSQKIYIGYYLHEGITEYMAFKIHSTSLIENKLKGFGFYGKKNISPSYGPYVWLIGAYNALYDNLLIKSYYAGEEVSKSHRKKIISFTNAVSKFIINKEIIEAILYEREELVYDFNSLTFLKDKIIKQLSNRGISNSKRNKKLAVLLNQNKDYTIEYEDIIPLSKSIDSDNISDLLISLAKVEHVLDSTRTRLEVLNLDYKTNYKKMTNNIDKAMQFLMEQYKLQLHIIPEKVDIREFSRCMDNLANFNYTWKELLKVPKSDDLFVANSKEFDALRKKFNAEIAKVSNEYTNNIDKKL